MPKAKVAIVKGTEEEKLIQELFSLMGGVSRYIKKGHSVLIKPNLAGVYSYKTGITTNPGIVAGIIRALRGIGVKDIFIGEGTGELHKGTIRAMEETGYRDIAHDYGCQLIDLNKDKTKLLPVPQPHILKQIKVSNFVTEVDAIINVAVMKTHFITGVSLGMKNLKGCVPPAERRKMHAVGVNEAIVDLNQVIKPAITIIDGTVGLEGLGPIEGEPVGMNVVVGGDDIIAVEATAARIMGLEPREIKHIRLASETGLGEIDLSMIEVRGKSIAAVRRNFKKSHLPLSILDEFKIYNGNPCSGCIGSALISVHHMKASGLLKQIEARNLRLAIAFGPQVSNVTAAEGDFLVVIGNCARGVAKQGLFVRGCAPTPTYVKQIITAKLAATET